MKSFAAAPWPLRRGFIVATSLLMMVTLMSSMPSSGAESAVAAARILAPSGRLRVAINFGNAVLAQRDAASGELRGVSVTIAQRLGKALHVPVELIPYAAAGDVFDALNQGAWDVAFLAVQPERAIKIDFTAPYVVIDGTYLVHSNSRFHVVADLDQTGARIAVSRGAAYDLFLTRTLKHARLERAATTTAAIDLFLSGSLDAAAGIRQALLDAASQHPGLRVLDDRFTRIEQAIAIPKDRAAAGAFVRQVLQDMKVSGEVRAALDATGQNGAIVAP